MARVRRLGFIPPQLPSLTDQPPEGAEWIHEVKHDGYRTMLVVEHGTARAYTRNGHDWSDRYPGIIAAARKLPCRSAILDGEVIVQDARGVSDFEALQAALRSQPAQLIFYAFDLLHLDGKDLREKPLIERRTKLKRLIEQDPDNRIQFSEEFIGDAAAFFHACAAHELEGIVSKLATSRYRSGRSKTWLKTKCFRVLLESRTRFAVPGLTPAACRFPPPWTVEQTPGGFKVKDAHGQSLAYVYGRETKADADIAHVLTMDEARRIASNIAKLPSLLVKKD
jgi:DNA ligase D-like protein (predicted ligase)